MYGREAPEEADGLRELAAAADLEAAAAAPRALIFKDSPRCGMSARALREVQAFARERPEVPVYRVDVVRRRDLSRRAAERFGVRHQSPQVLLLRDGVAVWNASHFRITSRAIRRETERDRERPWQG